MKIKKIEKKEITIVSTRINCTRPGKPHYYGKDDCLYDCTAVDRPRWWQSKYN